jgi:hypothetical protein
MRVICKCLFRSQKQREAVVSYSIYNEFVQNFHLKSMERNRLGDQDNSENITKIGWWQARNKLIPTFYKWNTSQNSRTSWHETWSHANTWRRNELDSTASRYEFWYVSKTSFCFHNNQESDWLNKLVVASVESTVWPGYTHVFNCVVVWNFTYSYQLKSLVVMCKNHHTMHLLVQRSFYTSQQDFLKFVTPNVNILQDGLDLDTYLYIIVSWTIARTTKLLYSVT